MTLKFSVNIDKVRRRKVERELEAYIKNLEENGAQQMTEMEKEEFRILLLKKLETRTKKASNTSYQP